MFAEILVGDRWVECRLIQQGGSLQAWFSVAVLDEGEPRFEPAMFQVPSGGTLRWRARGEVNC